MAQAPPTGNIVADAAIFLGSKLFMDKLFPSKREPFRSRQVRLGRRMQDYIPELDKYVSRRGTF